MYKCFHPQTVGTLFGTGSNVMCIRNTDEPVVIEISPFAVKNTFGAGNLSQSKLQGSDLFLLPLTAAECCELGTNRRAEYLTQEVITAMAVQTNKEAHTENSKVHQQRIQGQRQQQRPHTLTDN